jgi:hypothetical protein
MYLDVFSCKDFDEALVKQIVRDYFGSDMVQRTQTLIRNAPRRVPDLELQ